MIKNEKIPKRPVVLMIVLALFFMYTGFVVADECPYYLDDLIDVDARGADDRDFIRYNALTANWSLYDLYNNAQVWNQQHTFNKYIECKNNIELTNKTQNNLITFDGFADYIISHNYVNGRLTFGVPPFSHENIFNSDIWINNSDIYTNNIDVDTDIIMDTDSKIQVGSTQTNISYGGTGVIDYEASGGLSPAHQFYIKGMKLFQFAGGFTATTYVRVNPDSNNCDLQVYSDDGTKTIESIASSNLVRLRDAVAVNQSSVVSPSALSVQGGIQADDYYSSDNSRGWSGTFQTGGFPPLTVTVKNGIIVDVS